MKPRNTFRFLGTLTKLVAQAALMLTLILLLIPTSTSSGDELGDVNLDGAVNFLDISPFIDVLSAGTYQVEADTNEDSAVNFLDISSFIAILIGIPDDSPLVGVSLGVAFSPDDLVEFIVVDIKNSWLCENENYEFFLDIEITGVNGGFAFHGSQFVSVHESETFDVNGPIATVIIDWNTDTVPEHVNETYTVCVQVVRHDIQQDLYENIGQLKCRDFGPF